MLNSMKINSASVLERGFHACMLALACVFFISCKDEGAMVLPDENPVESQSILPAQGQRYTYKATDSEGGVSTAVLRVKNVKDSSGIEVYHIEQAVTDGDDKFLLDSRAYSHQGKTTVETGIPSGIYSIMSYISQFASIEDFELTGFPHSQIYENKTEPGSKVSFSAEPIGLLMHLLIPAEDRDPIIAEAGVTIQYNEGKLIREESVITPAGTFKCSKWEYSYEMKTILSGDGIPQEESEVVYTIHQWTAPGIGVVKSIEASGSDVSTTELQKINKE
jgi:hypothetical protein